MFVGILISLFTLHGFTATVVPKTLPEWQMELVAAAPQLKHPSVVCSAPDGRVFVAEDPMDISAPADATLGRILCFHPGGKVTIFADKLYAVFGMQYLEGKLYVLHNPKFSVFTDHAGLGSNRVDLIASTHPNPSALDWNDHVPANFRLGMDGYFYAAVGDKGVYGAVGQDNKRVDLHGGGILRLRPDGTGLEVFCRGVRNILDVAMNEHDEIFTYDNTDEQQWMGRLTHMVDGGFYGYPYDFIPRRPYTLWMMEDYGGGAATGALCYNDDALPAEYRGNLFLADFGKRQIMRVVLEKDGASYRAASKTDLFPDPPPDFRPVGIGWSADGRSIYICDWHHRDVKEDIVVGRLWKLTFTGPTRAQPKPDWYLPAAMGQPCTTTDAELCAALDHPSHAVRLTAQRQLGQREAALPLATVLTNSAASPRARAHALWALHSTKAASETRKLLAQVAQDPEPTLRRQALRVFGERADAAGLNVALTNLSHPDASVRFQAATTLGRIAACDAIEFLLPALTEPDPFTRYAVFTALNRMGRARPSCWGKIVQGLTNEIPAIRTGVQFALRETYDGQLAKALGQTARDERIPLRVREDALVLLAAIHHQVPEWRGEWWAYHPVNAAPPVKKVVWSGTPLVLATLQESLRDSQASLRLSAAHGLSSFPDASPELRRAFTNETHLDVRRAMVDALGSMRDLDAISLLASLVRNPSTSPGLLSNAVAAAVTVGGSELIAELTTLLPRATNALRAQTLSALGKLKASNAAPAIAESVTSSDPAVHAAASEALTAIGGTVIDEPLRRLLTDSSSEVRRRSITVAGRARRRTLLPDLLRAYEQVDTRPEAIAALAQMADVRALNAYLEGLSGKNAALRDSCRKAITQIQVQAWPQVQGRLQTFTPEVLTALRAVYATNREASKILLTSGEASSPAEYQSYATQHGGNPARGREIFFNESGVGCIKCHTVAGRGNHIGPDLTTVGAQFGRETLIESILDPSKAVREGYNQVMVETRDNEEISGVFKGETSEELTLLDSENRLRRIAKSEIKERRNSQVSMMPEGLQSALTLAEFADLVAYLQSLKL